MWQIAGAGLHICLSPAGSGEKLPDLSRGVFRSLIRSGVVESGVGGGDGRQGGWLEFQK